MTSTLKEISSNKCFDGYQKIYSHESTTLKCQMNFGVYIPATAKTQKVSVLYWLSGLLCTENFFVTRIGAQRFASKHNILVVNPDTSPRNCGVDEADNTIYYGSGAGYYIDATEEKWKNNFQMYSYITKELPQIISENFNVTDKKSIFGHSMGGHGALLCALRNPGMYNSISAFSPGLNPKLKHWGQLTFKAYLGSDENTWKDYDSTELVKKYNGPLLNILIDIGTEDEYLSILLPENFLEAAKNNEYVNVSLRMQEGYDHSNYFISTFIEDHFNHHTKYL